VDYHVATPSVELLTQEYLAARRELRSRSDLTPAQHERLREDLADEHRRRCTQEWKIVLAQLRADHSLLTTSSG
jgi:hypothetical protein